MFLSHRLPGGRCRGTMALDQSEGAGGGRRKERFSVCVLMCTSPGPHSALVAVTNSWCHRVALCSGLRVFRDQLSQRLGMRIKNKVSL